MKKYTLFFITLFGVGTLVQAQNKQLLYDFSEIPQSLMVNPGVESSFQWYAGMPFFSGASIQAGSSGITVLDLFANDGLDINDKIRERALFGMDPSDDLSGTLNIELFSGGYRGKNNPSNFYSFGAYLEGDGIGYWFQDIAILAIDGNANMLDRRFDLSDIKARGELLTVYHFGLNKQLNRNLTVGVRAKLYNSIANFTSTRNEGFFVTTEGQNNTLASTLDANLELKTSGLNDIRRILQDDNANRSAEISSLLTERAIFSGNVGLGVDLGFTYKLNEQTVLTGSILDLGFVYHSVDTRNVFLNGAATIEGVEVILPDALLNPSADLWQNLIDEVEDFIPFDTENEGYISFRPTKLNASIRHDFGKPVAANADCDCNPVISGRRNVRTAYTNSVGGHLYVINRPRGPIPALTGFYQRRFGNVLSLRGSYTVDKYSFTNVGLGISIQAGPVNMYAMADNLLSYQNIADSHYASFQLGLNIISWGRK